jgi:hypothetical protein
MKRHGHLMEWPATNSVGVPLPPVLAMLADALLDLGFEDWPDRQAAKLAGAALGQPGLQVPGRAYKLRNEHGTLVVEASSGTEPQLPAGWLRFVTALLHDSAGNQFSWVGKDVRPERRPPDMSGYVDAGDGWVPAP